MTERQKVADLPQEEREQLIKRAADAGIRNTMIATWYVDTLEAKIAAAIAKKNETPADDATPGTDGSQQKDEQADDQDNETPADDAPKADETPADVSGIDPKAEAEQLDKDIDPPAPVTAPASQKAKIKAAKEISSQVVKICHICRGKVINGKCSSCGFEISKR